MLALATGLVEAGVPLDGIGFQGHLIVGNTPALSTLKNNLAAFTALGLEVAYTELGMPMALLLSLLVTHSMIRYPTDPPCH